MIYREENFPQRLKFATRGVRERKMAEGLGGGMEMTSVQSYSISRVAWWKMLKSKWRMTGCFSIFDNSVLRFLFILLLKHVSNEAIYT